MYNLARDGRAEPTGPASSRRHIDCAPPAQPRDETDAPAIRGRGTPNPEQWVRRGQQQD